MAKKKTGRVGVRTKRKTVEVRRSKEGAGEVRVPADLSDAERDIVSHMEQGWRLETDSLRSNPVLRNLKDNEVVRPLSANRSTVEALEERGLIAPDKSGEPLTIAWQLRKEK